MSIRRGEILTKPENFGYIVVTLVLLYVRHLLFHFHVMLVKCYVLKEAFKLYFILFTMIYYVSRTCTTEELFYY